MEYQAGFNKIDITPDFAVPLGGYASRTKLTDVVEQPIYVRVMALRENDKAPVLFISLELIGASAELCQAVRDHARQHHAIPPENCLINTSHTHSGPNVSGCIPSLWLHLPGAKEAEERYFAILIPKILQAVDGAIADLAPVQLAFAQGQAGFAVNRRRVHPGCAHLPGPVDHDVPVLKISAADGTVRGYVFGYACHTTTLAGDEINGDWAGKAMTGLESATPGATALFLIGCGADQNPLPRRSKALRDAYGMIMAAAVLEASDKAVPLLTPLLTRMTIVDLPLQPVPTEAEIRRNMEGLNPIMRRGWESLLERAKEAGGIAQSVPVEILLWQFGDALKIITLGGEAVVDYALRLKQSLGFESTWVCGYTGPLQAYLPSERVLAEGGYEGASSQVWFGWSAPFAPGIEERIMKAVQSCA